MNWRLADSRPFCSKPGVEQSVLQGAEAAGNGIQNFKHLSIYIYYILYIYNTHEHILYKMTGVKVCYILFYAPPAALLPGVTHPTL